MSLDNLLYGMTDHGEGQPHVSFFCFVDICSMMVWYLLRLKLLVAAQACFKGKNVPKVSQTLSIHVLGSLGI